MLLKRNLIANFIGQGWVALMGLAFLPLYIKYLGIEAYGVVGFYGVMQGCLVLLDMGMTPTLNRELARFTAGAHTPASIGDLVRSLEIVAATMALLIGIGVWLLAPWLASDWLRAERLPTTEVAEAIVVMGWVLALRLLEGLYRGALLGLQKQVWLNAMASLLATLRWGGAVAILATVSPTIGAFFIWQGIVSGLTVVVFALAIRRALAAPGLMPQFSAAAVRGVGGFAGGMMATMVLAIVLTQADKLLLSRLLNLESFGHYTFAATVATALLMAVTPITQAFYPRFTEQVSRNDVAALTVSYHRGAQLVTVTLLPAGLTLAVFGETILELWTGSADVAQATAPLLALLTLGTIFNGLMYIPSMLLLAYGWSGFSARVNLVAVSLLVPAIFWVAPRYGAIGAAWVWVALNIGYVLIAIHFMHRSLLSLEKWRWYGVDIACPLLSVLPCLLLSRCLFPDTMGTYGQAAWIAVTWVVCVAAAVVAASTLRPHAKALLFP